jgi:hypothetical protein
MKDKKPIPFDSLRVLLGMKELPKVPEVEVYQGQQFLFSTNKKSKQQESAARTVNEQWLKPTIQSIVEQPKIELVRKDVGQRTGKFSLVSSNSNLFDQTSLKPLTWFDRSEAQYAPLESSELSVVDGQRVGKLNLKFDVFKRKWQCYLNAKKYQSVLKKTTVQALAVHNVKKSATSFDKLINYYDVQVPRTRYAHKAFIALEMQLNSMLIKTRLAPYQYMVEDLCFYELVRINGQPARNVHHVLGLYDLLAVSVQFHNYINVRNNRIVNYPHYVRQFFKEYWAHTANANTSKVWLLSNFVKSDVTSEAVVFDYPNILLYMAPFARFTKMYYENTNLPAKGTKHEWLNYTHTVFKLKLFEFASYYR